MAAPYDYNNGYNGEPINRAPSPYHEQNGNNDYYNQHPQQYDQVVHQTQPAPYSEGPTPASEASESDRGIFGAVAGGASGAYVGHQTCHGFLGTVGGAIVGSLTEDWAKKKRDGSRPCSPKPPPTVDPPAVCYPPPPSCPPVYHHPVGAYSAPLVHTQTNVSSHTDVSLQPGMTHHHGHQPQYPHHTPPPTYGHPVPTTHPTKPCGHTHTCACKWFGKH